MRSTKYLLIEHRLGKPLDKVLAEYREARLSAPAISRLLTAQTGVTLSSPTVRTWLADVDVSA